VRWHELWEGNPILATPADVAKGERVHRLKNASGCRPYIRYPFTRDTGWHYTPGWSVNDYRGRLYLAPAERQTGVDLRATHGPYVLIEPSPKPDQPNRQWPWARYAAVVDACPAITFVQPVHARTKAVLPGTLQMPCQIFRETCGLLAATTCYVGPEGGLAHAAAALRIPAVAIFGGCVSVPVMGYVDHVNLADTSPETPCGRIRPCPHCVTAMEAITVEQVVGALRGVVARQEQPQ
jgi:ADP-heptose:LPS heptosyltransferase